MILSICIVTMNRAEKLKRALDSCMHCDMPSDDWEMVIVDNASTDNTSNVVNDFFQDRNIKHTFISLNQNLGVGGGRNVAFNEAKGKYVYVLDDDAIIDYQNHPDFFLKAIAILEQNKKFASLTTQIYDEALKKNRLEDYHLPLGNNLYICMMFCGGSHFLRKPFFAQSPYLDNMYGMEELMPSLKAFGEGLENVFTDELRVIHQPETNKWTKDSCLYNDIALNYCVLNYEIKKKMYPKMIKPVCFLAYKWRLQKHFGGRVDRRKVYSIKDDLQRHEAQFDYVLSMQKFKELCSCFKISVF